MKNIFKNNKGKGAIAIISIVTILIVACFAGFAIFSYNVDAATKTMLAVMNISKNKKIAAETITTLKFNKDSDLLTSYVFPNSTSEQKLEFFNKILSKLKYRNIIVQDLSENPIYIGMNLDLLYNEKELADLGISITPLEIVGFSKSLLGEKIFYPLSKELKNFSGVDLSQINFTKYIDVLYKEDSFQKNLKDTEYFKKTKDFIEKHSTHMVSDSIVMEVTIKDLFSFYKDLISIAKDDNKLQESVINKVNEILKLAEEDKDYELLGFSKETFDTVAGRIKTDIEKNWKEGINALAEQLNELNEEQSLSLANDIKYKITMLFSGMELKSTVVEFNMYGMEITSSSTILDNKKDYRLSSDANSVEFKNQSIMDIVNTNKILENLLSSEGYEEFSKDVVEIAKEHLNEKDAENIISQMDSIKTIFSMGLN